MTDDIRQTAAPGLSRMGRMRFWTAIVVGACALVTLLSLGAWQVERLAWKEALVARIDARIHADPVPLSTLAAETDVDYRPVSVSGRFLHSGERYFLATLEGQAGWNVFTPFLAEGTQDAVFVNRGFVPYEMKDPATRMAGQIEGEMTVTGLARAAPTEAPGFFAPENDLANHTFFWRDVAGMSEGLDLPAGTDVLPFTVDAAAGAAPGGYPVGGVTVVSIPNNHLQYAITWFGLAVVLTVMLAILVVARLRGRA